MKAIIAVPDFTRGAHLKRVLPGLIKRLRKQNVSEKDMEIIIATGLHRSPTKSEILKHLGNIAKKIKISSHNHRKKYVAYFGRTPSGISIYLNKKLKNADMIVTIGVVEPHLYAGYSGGVKVVSIGLAGEKTINSTHHPKFLDHSATGLCSIKNNPFRDFIDEAGKLLPIKYSVNIINDRDGKLSKVFYGEPRGCFKRAVNYSKKIFEKKINKCFDVIICDIPKEKSVNIYQSSRAFNYVANTKNPALKNNPIILVKAGLSEGFGKGLGEKRFKKTISRMKTPEKLVENIKKKGCLAGEHRAYLVAKAMLKAELGFISDKAPLYEGKSLPFLFFRDLKEARKFISDYFKKTADICYLKNAFGAILIKSRN